MRVIDWLFRDRRTGAITVAQLPNVALWIFIVAVVLRLFLSGGGGLRPLLDVVAAGSLGWWSVDEMVRGVNPWRRILGGLGAWFTLVIVIDLIT